MQSCKARQTVTCTEMRIGLLKLRLHMLGRWEVGLTHGDILSYRVHNGVDLKDVRLVSQQCPSSTILKR